MHYKWHKKNDQLIHKKSIQWCSQKHLVEKRIHREKRQEKEWTGKKREIDYKKNWGKNDWKTERK